MMRTHTLWILIVMTAALMMGGVGCKKEDGAADTSYVVDPKDGQTPDSCLSKGAVGAMGMMLKQTAGAAACPDLNPEPPSPPVCGNGIIEASGGEACDDGAKNGSAGNSCDAKCQKKVPGDDDKGGGGGGGGGTVPGGTVKIVTTKPLPDGKMGGTYSATITASGAKAKDKYKWTISNLPEGYVSETSTGSGSSFKIASKGVVKLASDKPYTPKVTVCLESNPADCATCPAAICSFSIKDQYRIEAYSLPYNAENHTAVCSSDEACNEYALKATPLFTVNDIYYVLKLWVKDGSAQIEPVSVPPASEPNKNSYKWDPVKYPDVGFAEDYSKLYYHWSITVDGKAAPFVKWMDYVMKNTLDSQAQNSLFLMDTTDDMKSSLVYPSMAYIMVGPKAMGQTFKNVVVTVASANGGNQKIVIDKITVPSLTEINVLSDACHNMQVKKLSIDTETYTPSGGNGAYTVSVNKVDDQDKALRVNQAYEGTLDVTGGSGGYKISNLKYDYDEDSVSNAGDPTVTAGAGNGDGLAVEWSALSSWKSQNYTVSDATSFDVSDTSTKCPQTIHVTINRTLKYPDSRTMKISDLKLWANFAVDDASWNDSWVKFEVLGNNDDGNQVLLASTGNIKVSGNPQCFNDYYTLNPEPGREDVSIGKITKVTYSVKDDYMAAMNVNFKYLRLDVGNPTSWYALAEKDINMEESGDGWNDGDYSAFKQNTDGSIWFYGDPAYHPEEGGGDDGIDCD